MTSPVPAEREDRFESREFYELCQQYRWAREIPQTGVVAAFDALKDFCRAALAERPAASSQPVALTEMQIIDATEHIDTDRNGYFIHIARAIEAAHGIGAATPSRSPEALRDRLQQKCSDWGTYWRASDAHGVELTLPQALELLVDALGVEVEIKAADSARETDAQVSYEMPGYALAMRVMQSDLYLELDDRERAECDAFIAEGQGRAAPVAEPPIAWWNGIRKTDERDGTGPSFAPEEGTHHDIPVYSHPNPCNAPQGAAPVADQDACKESEAVATLTAEGWVWDGDQWVLPQQPAPQEPELAPEGYEKMRGGKPVAYWRDSALEAAAGIAEQYQADPWIARDIRAMKRRPSWRALPPDDDERSYNAQGAPQEPVAWRYKKEPDYKVWWFSENDPSTPSPASPEGWGKNWSVVEPLYLAATPQSEQPAAHSGEMAMLKATYRTSETGGGKYRMVFNFANITDLHAACCEWDDIHRAALAEGGAS